MTVTSDLLLPAVGPYGSSITWASDHEDVISRDGRVTRPLTEDVMVTLTATLKFGNATDSLDLSVLVPRIPEPVSGTVTLVPEADTFVHDVNPGTSYGTNDKLLAGRGREAYLRFNMNELVVDGTIMKATLRLYKLDSNTNVLSVTKVTDDSWDNTITFNTKPAPDGGELTQFTASGKNVYVETDLTDAVRAEYEGDKKLSIHLQRVAGSEYANEFVSTRGAVAEQHPVLILEIMTDEQIVAADKESLSAMDGMVATSDLSLPATGSYGSTITWVSDNPAVITDDGKVTRPAETEDDAVVNLTATIKYGRAQDTLVITVYVPKMTPPSPFMRDSLERLIAFARTEAEKAVIGTEPGQYLADQLQLFEEAIVSAEQVWQDPDGNHALAVNELVNAGKKFFDSVVVSDRVVDEKNQRLEYSVYRRELVRLLWEAKAALLIEPELYTEAAKIALRDQIDHAEKVLNGTYEVPFVRNREFVKPRPDEDIQFAIEHFSKAPSYNMSTYGLKPALQWYKTQHILMDAFHKMSLAPVADTYVQSGANSGTNFGNAQKGVLSNDRYVYLKFDLSQVPGRIVDAVLEVTNAKNDNNLEYVHWETNDNWTENGFTYDDVPKDEEGNPVFGPVIGSWMLGTLNTRSSVRVTEAAISEQAGDGILTLSVTQDPNARFPGEFYLKEYPDASKHPALVVTIDAITPEKLNALFDKVTGLAHDLLRDAQSGSEVGQYPQQAIDQLNQRLAEAQTAKQEGNPYRIGAALVNVYNAMRDMRYAQVLRTDVEPDASLFYTAEGLEELRKKIATNPVLKQEFDKLKAMSDEMTLDQIKGLFRLWDEDPDWDSINNDYKIWSEVKNQNFTPPSNAVTANLMITLPAEENEAEGLGHVWVDQLRIYPVTGSDWNIQNASFESGSTRPDHWIPTVISGNPVLRWEDRPNRAFAGSRSVYIENPTANDQGAWVYDQDIPIQGGIGHTLQYAVKIDGLFKEGVQIILTFKDANGNVVGQYVNTNNHKSDFGAGGFNLTFQTDALVYAVTGDVTYAEKAKYRMLWFLNDHLQGIESWLVYNQRPFGYDAYGAVQSGRNASSLASAYSLIKNAGVFTKEEHDLFLRQVEYLLRNLSDLRDRTELTDYEAQLNTGNWEMDMSAGASMLAMALGDELPYARQWIDNGKKIVQGQLKYTVRADGGWPESLRYHFASLERIPAFAKALRNVTGEDWFGSGVLKNMFRFSVEVQTPAYSYFDGKISTPNFGDHVLSGGAEFGAIGLYYNEIAATDPELAAQMYETWVRAGRPLRNYWGEAVVMENFFAPFEFDNTNNVQLELRSTDALRPWGMVLFRHNFKRYDETYFAMIANESPIGHNHNDQGSFIFYAGGEPLVMDPGIESYFDTSKSWYVSSSAHATVQFKSGGSYKDTPNRSVWNDFYASRAMDYAQVVINHPSGAEYGTHTRSVAYVKNGIDALVIWDHIQNAQEGTRWNLPIAATSTEVTGNKALSVGHGQMDLETTILEPAAPQITTEFGRSYAQLPAIDGLYQLNYLRIEAQPGENFLTVLYPKPKDSEGLESEALQVHSDGVRAYRLETPDGKWFIVAVNEQSGDRTVTLPASENLQDLRSGAQYVSENGLVQVPLEGKSLYIFKPQSLADSVPAAIRISGSGQVEVPSTGVHRYSYAAEVNDQYGDKLSDETVVWSLIGAPDGISVDAARGILTVAPGVANGTFKLAVTAGEVTETVQIAIVGGSDPGTGPEPDPGAPPSDGAGDGSSTADGVSPQDETTDGGAIRIIGKDELLETKDGVLRVTLEEDESGVSLPAADIGLLGEHALELVRPGATVIVPAAVWRQYGELVSGGTGSRDRIVLKVEPVGEDLSLTTPDPSVSVTRGGQTCAIDLALVRENGDEIRLEGSQTVRIELSYAPGADEELLGVYRYDEANGTWVYVGGKVDGEKRVVVADVRPAGKYAVLAYDKTFADVAPEHWAYRTLKVLAARGIVKGETDRTFNPSGVTTRAEFAALLVRALGLSPGETAVPFDDVREEDWYAADVAVAYAAGIVSGVSGRSFAPNEPVTREQMAAMIVRAYERATGLAMEPGDLLDTFADADSVSDWAKTLVAKAVKSGFMKGKGAGRLDPQSYATRAEAAHMVYHLIRHL